MQTSYDNQGGRGIVGAAMPAPFGQTLWPTRFGEKAIDVDASDRF